MPEFVAQRETKLKRFPVDSATLEADDLWVVPAGTKFTPQPTGLQVADHSLWAMGTRDLWWAFDSHWQPSQIQKASRDSAWIDERCIALVKKFEGFRAQAYQDAVGVWTIGYGETSIGGVPVKPGDTTNEEAASLRLRKGLAEYGDRARRLIQVPITRSMADAITSFCWNLGPEAFRTSTLLRKLNQGDYMGATGEFSRWVYAGNEVLDGLVSRRATEAKLFLEDGIPTQKGKAAVPFSHRDMTAQASKHFKWGEVWQWQDQRITDDPVILGSIQALAVELDKLRERFGPIQVTSWYRNQSVNQAVGGASGSRHLRGDAADCYPLATDPRTFERWCDEHWNGGVGLGITSGSGFVHLDLGERRRWAYGS